MSEVADQMSNDVIIFQEIKDSIKFMETLEVSKDMKVVLERLHAKVSTAQRETKEHSLLASSILKNLDKINKSEDCEEPISKALALPAYKSIDCTMPVSPEATAALRDPPPRRRSTSADLCGPPRVAQSGLPGGLPSGPTSKDVIGPTSAAAYLPSPIGSRRFPTLFGADMHATSSSWPSPFGHYPGYSSYPGPIMMYMHHMPQDCASAEKRRRDE
jgi:hypothetical protein